MSAIPSIKELAPELDFPGFWDLKNLFFLKAILSVCKSHRIKKDDLPKIGTAMETIINSMLDSTSAPKQKYKFNNANKKQCNEVIDHLQKNGWSCSFYQLKAKPYRPSLLPMQEKELLSINAANQIREEFWAGVVNEQIDIPKVALLEAVASTGININKLLSALHNEHIHTAAKGWLEVPISRGSAEYIKLPI